MEDFINTLVGLLPSPLRGAAQAIVSRILAVWTSVTGFWGRVRGGWQTIRNAAWGRLQAQLRHAYALAVTLRWLITVYVPRQAGIYANAVLYEARSLFDRAVAGARAELAQLRNFALDQLASLGQWFSQWLAILRFDIGVLQSDGKRLLEHVFGPLATPQRLASWAIGAIIHAGVGWLKDNAVALGQLLVAQRARIVLNSLGWFEDLFSRIL